MKIKLVFLALIALPILASCQQNKSSNASKVGKGMVKITILYPNGEGKTFDMDYYSNKHMPMCASLFGDALKSLQIDKGIAGRTPEDPLPYLAIGYFYFDSLSAYLEVFGPNKEKIRNDISNYTNIQPVVQISEVVE